MLPDVRHELEGWALVWARLAVANAANPASGDDRLAGAVAEELEVSRSLDAPGGRGQNRPAGA